MIIISRSSHVALPQRRFTEQLFKSTTWSKPRDLGTTAQDVHAVSIQLFNTSALFGRSSPGFDDTYRPYEAIVELIGEWLQKSRATSYLTSNKLTRRGSKLIQSKNSKEMTNSLPLPFLQLVFNQLRTLLLQI